MPALLCEPQQAGSLGKDIAKNVPTKEDVPNLTGGLGGDAQDAGGKVCLKTTSFLS